MSDAYEMRWDRFVALRFERPAVHVIPGLAHWLEYAVDTDFDAPEWEDRANGFWVESDEPFVRPA